MKTSNLMLAKKTCVRHGNAVKFVFEENGWNAKTLTQAAFGIMRVGDYCNLHAHESMTEVFYFISGEGVYKIEDKEYTVNAGVYLRIDPGEFHELKVKNELHYFYIGIPTQFIEKG